MRLPADNPVRLQLRKVSPGLHTPELGVSGGLRFVQARAAAGRQLGESAVKEVSSGLHIPKLGVPGGLRIFQARAAAGRQPGKNDGFLSFINITKELVTSWHRT